MILNFMSLIKWNFEKTQNSFTWFFGSFKVPVHESHDLKKLSRQENDRGSKEFVVSILRGFTRINR